LVNRIEIIVVEDLPKTTAMTSSILSGEDIEVFENRYRKKKKWYCLQLMVSKMG
jgi:hypothetical protein